MEDGQVRADHAWARRLRVVGTDLAVLHGPSTRFRTYAQTFLICSTFTTSNQVERRQFVAKSQFVALLKETERQRLECG